jgi:hypothetical protein
MMYPLWWYTVFQHGSPTDRWLAQTANFTCLQDFAGTSGKWPSHAEFESDMNRAFARGASGDFDDYAYVGSLTQGPPTVP